MVMSPENKFSLYLKIPYAANQVRKVRLLDPDALTPDPGKEKR